jgi:C4-dicarboxylate-specific signal transduction histidine kinase
LVIVFMARRWRLAMRVLEQQAQRVGAGDRLTGPPPPMPTLEMVSLQRSFTEMERNLVSLERQVVRQERLAAIGVLVSGIAHELNNPLQAIAGRAELVARDPSVAVTARNDLALIQKESARASAIIRNLSHFSRQQDEPPRPILLRDVVASVVELRQRELEDRGVQLVLDERSRAPVLGVFTEFQQVILNFVINAEQAMAEAEAQRPRALTIRTFDRDGRTGCEVEDTGPGVPAEDEPKLFQPFFTTKPVGEGTGLGLSVSYGIIHSYGGVVGYRRAATGGAILWFDVPAHQ